MWPGLLPPLLTSTSGLKKFTYNRKCHFSSHLLPLGAPPPLWEGGCLVLGVKMLTIKSTREGPLYWLPLELKLAELEPEKDLAPESELDVTEDIENEVGLLALT